MPVPEPGKPEELMLQVTYTEYVDLIRAVETVDRLVAKGGHRPTDSELTRFVMAASILAKFIKEEITEV